jgi:CHAT domain-containing protein/Tfp pilus assembly protein PilF
MKSSVWLSANFAWKLNSVLKGIGMKLLRVARWMCTGLLCFLALASLGVRAQIGDEATATLSESETLRWRQILDAPMDPNMLNSSKSRVFSQKVLAAGMLGEITTMERYGREWLLIEPVNAKWSLYYLLKGTEKRAEAYKLGHMLIQEDPWPPSRVRIRAQLANDYMDDHQYKQASQMLEEAEKIVRIELGNIPRRGDTPFYVARAELEFYMSKSTYLMRTGKWAEGIQTAKLAVEKGKELLRMASMISSADSRAYGQGMALTSMVQLSTHQVAAGLYSDAEWSLREAYKLSKSYGFSENQMPGFYNRTADLYNATGQFKDALIFAKRSEKVVLSQGYAKGSPRWLFSQARVSMAYAGQDQWPQAMANIELTDQTVGALSGPSTIGNNAYLRAYVNLKNGQNDRALAALEKNLAWNIDNFGESHYLTASLRGMYAVALLRNKRPEEARMAFEKSMQNMTAPESLTGDFVEDAFQRKGRRFVLQSYMQLLAQTAQSQPKDAEIIFQIADQLNASSVQQALSDAAVRAGVSVPGLSDIIRQEQDAKNEIATLTGYISGQSGEDNKRRNPQIVDQMRARMRELEIARKEYKAQINKSYPEYFQLIQPRSPTPSDVAKQLKPDELFVSILPLEDKTYVWAIDSQGKVDFHAADMSEQQTQTVVERIRKTLDVAYLGERAPPFDYADSHLLYQQLLSPFKSALEGKKHLIVATSGALSRLPMAVLTLAPYSGRDPALAPWLLRQAAVSHVPTANGWLSLKRLGSSPSSTQPLMAWGDPKFDVQPAQQVAVLPQGSVVRSGLAVRSADLKPRNVLDPDTYVTYSKLPTLPETRDEVLELAKILSANPEQDVILGAQATRASVLKSSASGQLGRKQVVVFATHGLLAGDLPNLNQPALAMASTANPADSPLLTLEDVLSLKLNADWVVLSACNTAGADGRAGDALTGLARGFFFAGSRSLLVTHWSVESESAMMLTTQTFATYQKNGEIRRAEALRQAMLATMALPRYAHPAFWAPYALVGEGGR